MRSRLLLTVLLLGGTVALAGPAWAHGGGFRMDNGNGAAGPSVGDVPAPVVTGPGTGGRTAPPANGTKRAFYIQEDWRVWWLLNSSELIPSRGVVAEPVMTDRTGPFDLGAPRAGNTPAWEMERQLVVRDTVLPRLLELVDPDSNAEPGIVATALIALGRLAEAPVPLGTFRRYALDPKATLEVRESAVLGLGLLRRTDAGRQLSASQLAEQRRFLLQLFDDKDAPNRVRAFAAYAIGLLADQPYGRSMIERDGRDMTRRLWRRVGEDFASADLRIALLTALSLQPAAGVPTGVRDGLRSIVRGANVFRRQWDGFERSHALTALARLEGPRCVMALLRTLGHSRQHVSVRTAAVLALAELAPRLDVEDRERVANAMRATWSKEPNWQAQGLYLIALGRVLAEDLRGGNERFIAGRRGPGAFLRQEVIRGSSLTRPFAALGLALAVHGYPARTRGIAAYRREAHKALELGLSKGRGADDVVAAFAVALGVSGAKNAKDILVETAKDRGGGGTLRGESCVALGMLGARDKRTTGMLEALLVERRSHLVFLGAVKGLSLMGNPGTLEILLKRLAKTRSASGRAAIAGGLGRLGDLNAVDPLIALSADEQKNVQTRAMAVVALGLICDPEPVPSRRRMTAGANYPARTAAMQQLFNIM